MGERIRQAKTLLSTSAFSVTEIAAECGFADRNYFSAAFRKETGQTPKEYRLKNSGSHSPKS
ncbi:MAG: helix-turn-helix transcriptional regulator, partial [Spirochaetia bacterium]|nr:helix-turn-helix transcriptional regulator [Spirochaetia bacterium]